VTRRIAGQTTKLKWTCILAAVAALPILPSLAEAARPAPYKAVQRGLEGLVAAPGGPPGAVATIHRGGDTKVLSAGRSDVRRPGRPRGRDHMRIASVAKAFSGAVALNLVGKGKLGLDDTIGQRLPALPVAWHPVTIRQMLSHTSGLPDYTRSAGFAEQARTNPRGHVFSATIIDWVSTEGLVFPPGSRYAYSNTDNIVVALIAEMLTHTSYNGLLKRIVFDPAKLTETSFDMRRVSLPRPFIHGYLTAPGEKPEDATTLLSPSGAWASGGIVSTPLDLARFVRAYLGGRFFAAAQKREQRRFVPGASSPPGPGTNAAGLALFRYRSRCGTVYGHTGNFPGYVQWAAASADGRRSVTTTLNIPAPQGALLARLRRVQASAVCALLR
jgi:D-alanyl-D-alanine carboxypeptidase